MEAKKKKGLSLRGRELVWGLIFISPWLVGVIFFFLYFLIQSVVFSFNHLLIGENGFDLVGAGVSHYRHLFLVDSTFLRELAESIGQMLIDVPLIIFFSLFMAILLNRAFLGRGLVRAIFFLPVIMATSAIDGTIADIMSAMMGGASATPEIVRSQSGFDVNSIAMMLYQFGIPYQIVNYIIEAISMLHSIIRAGGVQILIFLAALQAIPPSMYEVAQIEGATAYEGFWKITIPMVSPLILTNVVYTIVDTFIKSPVVVRSRETAFTSTVLFDNVSGMNFGQGSAMAVISSLAACLVLFIIGWAISKYVFYYN